MSKLTQIREQFRENLRVRSNDNNNNNLFDEPKVLERNKFQVKSELKSSNISPRVNSSSIPTWSKTKKQEVNSPAITSKTYSTSSQLIQNKSLKDENPGSRVKNYDKPRRSYPIAKKYNDQDFKSDYKNISKNANLNSKTNFNNYNKPDKVKSDIKTNKLSNKFGEKSRQLKAIINDNLKSLNVTEDDTLCRYCKRSFVPQDRLQKHEKVCLSGYEKQRFKFDSTKQRFKDKPNEYLLTYESSLKDEKNDMKKSNWRTQHDCFLATIRSAKNDNGNGNGSTYSRMIAATQEACNYCKRRFNSDALKRHLPICAKLYHKKVMIGDRVFRN